MFILILFAFLSGIVTILSPCILPVLPIVLSSALTGNKRKPFGIITGFILTFTIFTLFLSSIVKLTHISADSLRVVAIVLLILFGISLLIPAFQLWMEKMFTKLSAFSFQRSAKKSNSSAGFLSGLPIGASLGILWSPCVGPIMASVIALAATSTVSTTAFFITLAYSLGNAIPMLAILFGGRQVLMKAPFLLSHTGKIQKVFGVIMILTALAISFNLDRTFQTFILTTFPNYGTGLTKIEENPIVQQGLTLLNNSPNQKPDTSSIGKPMNDVQNQTGSNLPRIAKAPGFTKLSGEWINSKPLSIEELKGNVVLVDFWTYTCINCIRTLPYLKTWYEKYKDKGFVIVGVHTPEFEFEKNTDNVKKAVKDFGLTYPIVQDNSYGIWNEYSNQYWPAHYLIDKDGYIRDEHFGEGAYDETEKNIQELLREDGQTVNETIQNPSYTIHGQTPESYLGASRISNLSSPQQPLANKPTKFSTPKDVPLNTFAYSGEWTLSEEQAMPTKGATLDFNFSAQHVYLVMRPKDQTKPGMVKIMLNDENISTYAGEDVVNNTVKVTEDRLYRLIKLPQAGQGILHLEFLDNNLELYAFTFG